MAIVEGRLAVENCRGERSRTMLWSIAGPITSGSHSSQEQCTQSYPGNDDMSMSVEVEDEETLQTKEGLSKMSLGRTCELVQAESVLTQLVFEHALRIRMKSETDEDKQASPDMPATPVPESALQVSDSDNGSSSKNVTLHAEDTDTQGDGSTTTVAGSSRTPNDGKESTTSTHLNTPPQSAVFVSSSNPNGSQPQPQNNPNHTTPPNPSSSQYLPTPITMFLHCCNFQMPSQLQNHVNLVNTVDSWLLSNLTLRPGFPALNIPSTTVFAKLSTLTAKSHSLTMMECVGIGGRGRPSSYCAKSATKNYPPFTSPNLNPGPEREPETTSLLPCLSVDRFILENSLSNSIINPRVTNLSHHPTIIYSAPSPLQTWGNHSSYVLSTAVPVWYSLINFCVLCAIDNDDISQPRQP
ncbi:hypothetical protein K435DRAFT_859125 [Dendrothele bispora CBS 962.96]|uniref:Uncharacterized protein n=1 Tax=Dendrothele bispora (strain CBS 962.96) TaxID=1314807 RepID=A0A4S8M1X8_DENBC|nr:hypothetical protein K435DRAFT_859125 [Dendrothele bispora CBS 962.96]